MNSLVYEEEIIIFEILRRIYAVFSVHYIILAFRTNRMIKSIEWFTRLVSYWRYLLRHEKNGGQLHSDIAR